MVEQRCCSKCYGTDVMCKKLVWTDLNNEDCIEEIVDDYCEYYCHTCESECDVIDESEIPQSHFRREKINKIVDNIPQR